VYVYVQEHDAGRGPFPAAFVREARHGRGFPLPESTPARELLTHLNLLDGDSPTHAAVLLFSASPQRFLPTSEVKCAHFHGAEVAKPIPSYHTYKGTVFELVDQAVDFVMSKLDARVGTRADSNQAPVTYEIPREVVAEAIVNAVAHRDYTSNGSVQVMLFADRLEVWNPGELPRGLTPEDLRGPHPSIPHNPLIAEPLYLTQYIERMGTGTGDMIRRCRAAGLPAPEFTIRNGFVTTVRRMAVHPTGELGDRLGEGSGKGTTRKTTRKTTPNRGEQILALLCEDPTLSSPAIAERLGNLTTDGVKYHLDQLRAQGRLRRVGSTRGGHWQVLGEDQGSLGRTTPITTPMTTPIAAQKTAQNRGEQILALLGEDPTLSSPVIAERLGNLTTDGVKYHLDRLQAEGRLRHVGPTRGGHWEVLG